MATSLARVLLVCAVLASAACAKKEAASAPPLPMGSEGAACAYGCNEGLSCTPISNVCGKPDHPEHTVKRQADAERERAYLAQSGVQPPAHAEQPPVPPPAALPVTTDGSMAVPAATGAVRVVRASTGGKSPWVFAACRADERLVGGGCTPAKGNWSAIPGHLSGESATDTVGARWNCGWREATHDQAIEAFAMCQRL